MVSDSSKAFRSSLRALVMKLRIFHFTIFYCKRLTGVSLDKHCGITSVSWRNNTRRKDGSLLVKSSIAYRDIQDDWSNQLRVYAKKV